MNPSLINQQIDNEYNLLGADYNMNRKIACPFFQRYSLAIYTLKWNRLPPTT